MLDHARWSCCLTLTDDHHLHLFSSSCDNSSHRHTQSVTAFMQIQRLSSCAAQIAWQYIVTYPLPLIAKSLAAASANATAINTFYLSNDHLANYNDTGGVTPNHDTLYNQAFLDLSQVQLRAKLLPYTTRTALCCPADQPAGQLCSLCGHAMAQSPLKPQNWVFCRGLKLSPSQPLIQPSGIG